MAFVYSSAALLKSCAALPSRPQAPNKPAYTRFTYVPGVQDQIERRHYDPHPDNTEHEIRTYKRLVGLRLERRRLCFRFVRDILQA